MPRVFKENSAVGPPLLVFEVGPAFGDGDKTSLLPELSLHVDGDVVHSSAVEDLVAHSPDGLDGHPAHLAPGHGDPFGHGGLGGGVGGDPQEGGYGGGGVEAADQRGGDAVVRELRQPQHCDQSVSSTPH